MRIVEVELVLRRIDDVLRVRVLILLDLLLRERIGSVTRNPNRLIYRRLGIVRIRVNIVDASRLLGIDRGR